MVREMDDQGRPATYKHRIVYPFPLEKDLLRGLKEVAKREGKPVNHVLQELVENYIKKHAKGNPSFPLERWIEDALYQADSVDGSEAEKEDEECTYKPGLKCPNPYLRRTFGLECWRDCGNV